MNQKIGFIGAGNMATAIIEGMLRSQMTEPRELIVCDKNPERCEWMQTRGCTVVSGAREAVSLSDLVFLAVKPQNYAEVLEEISLSVSETTVLVSIAAGISTGYVTEKTGCEKVVRAMPNTPLLLGKGATALCRSAAVSEEEFEQVRKIFAASGMVEILEEEKMNAVISVNGSSPAYIYLLAKAMADGAAEQGIDPAAALRLIAATLEGSAKMLTDSGYTPEELIRMVSSPGGTTLKALEVFSERGLETVVKDAMRACTKRAEELGR